MENKIFMDTVIKDPVFMTYGSIYMLCGHDNIPLLCRSSKWLMLMDVAGIIQLPVVMHAINEHNVLLKDIDYASDEFKKLMSL